MPVARRSPFVSSLVRKLTVDESADSPAPKEAVFIRCVAVCVLISFILITSLTSPRPSLNGAGIAVLVAMILLVGAGIAAQPFLVLVDARRTIAALSVIAVCSIVLAAVQPNGYWTAGLYFVGIVAAVRLPPRTAMIVLGGALCPVVVGAAIEGDLIAAVSIPLGIVPWFLVMRAMRVVRDQREELLASRASVAEVAASAERGRLAREMHDVLAHSLSALALQLESTRLLARARGVDDDIVVALESAHSLAAGGLEEARRAIAAERNHEPPGPERISALADAFAQSCGLPVALAVHGEPHPLAPEARLAVYRTAQEALTNVRRHACAERVEVHLDYVVDGTVLVVEDHSRPGTPSALVPGEHGGGYGLTGMRERAVLLGGELSAAPTDGGFRVELRLPLTA